MKKFLSIKNSQGIYVARASFSSDETVIDFVNNKSTDDNYNPKPVSIVTNFTSDQLAAAEAASTSEQTIIESGNDTISVPSESLFVAKSPSTSSKKKRFNKVLTLLHLKKKTTKMSEHLNEDASKKSPNDLPSTSNSFPMLTTPKPVRSKGRTAALVKKFSLTPKKSPPKESTVKKSSIPLRTATSVETISNAPQLALQNRVGTTASVSHHSVSEMNLVNIDYRQESSSDNLDGGVKIGQTQYRTIRSSIASGSSSVDSGASSNLTRAWNASSNLSIRSGFSQAKNGNSRMGTGGRKSTSTEKLQITISGKKRSITADSASELQRKQQPSTEIEPNKFERKALTIQQQQQQQQPPKKLNINHDLTLMNTVGVPPVPTTQAPSTIPSYRCATTTAASIKKVVQRGATIKVQSTMQSQQSVDTSASAANVGQETIAPKQSAELLLITSFDVEEPEEIAAASKVVVQEKDSLLTEIIEAEQRNSMSMDVPESARGRRYPGVAASETIKFAHQSTSSSDTSGSQPIPPQPEIIPKVIIEEVTSLQSETSTSGQKESKSDDKKPTTTTIDDKDKELLHTLTQSSGAKVLQPNEENESPSSSSSSTAQPLQFERRNMSSSPEKREHLYKILVIGELGTGKTSFIKRYVHQFFSQNYRATIGVDFALKVLNWDQNTIIRLQLWDIAGQERFGNMTRVYYKEAVGAFIVFDVTRSATFDAVIKWKQDLDSKVQLPNGSPIPCILIANKCDQSKQGIVNTPAKMDEYVKEHGFAGWFETSAKENINIEEAARALVNKILLNDKIINAGEILDGEKFNLDGSSSDRPKKFCSC
ncbi:mucin-5AC isoform X1 [Sitodiplosis mosellana]|uniref:mucin-5AC isoform X1 n=2 Tax=Sitodiplosis mosellana TaxID=263140 RepID=UPI0024448B62|nr:mucin-5AC isoform X1 [Sitodiplosis mosellana]